jgi:fucose permease
VVGDLAAPVLLALVAFVGSSWRVVYAIVAGVLALWLAALGRVPTPVRGDSGNDRPPLFARVREALRDRVLVAWLFGKELCGLLDEIFVVFASLHVRLELHASALWQSAIVAAFMIGDAIGLVALDRLLRSRSERGLLAVASLGCIVVYVAWLAAPTPLVALVLAVPVGVFVAPLYPLAAAQAYACRPEASGSVLAAGHVFTPLSLALPWLLGLVADRAGTIVALACLLVQPVGLAALVAATRRVTRA